MSSAYFGRAGSTPPVVKNLIIINVLMYLATLGFQELHSGSTWTGNSGFTMSASPYFQPYQIITHMFMHGSIGHIFFNMFAFWMFGRVLETVWGGKRFFIYYMVTGLGAAFLHEVVYFILRLPQHSAKPARFLASINSLPQWSNNWPGVTIRLPKKLASDCYVPTIGASGAVFGVLLAFGVLFPNTQLFLVVPSHTHQSQIFCHRIRCAGTLSRNCPAGK